VTVRGLYRIGDTAREGTAGVGLLASPNTPRAEPGRIPSRHHLRAQNREIGAGWRPSGFLGMTPVFGREDDRELDRSRIHHCGGVWEYGRVGWFSA